MRLLIDTQVFIWFVTNAPDLRPRVRRLIIDGQNDICLSMASLREISIKTSIGKLHLNGPYEDVIQDVITNAFEVLPITFAHTVAQHHLPWHHRDPFDRLLAAQALTEGLDLMSSDDIFDAYFAGQAVRRWS